jgi:hypothetical protein
VDVKRVHLSLLMLATVASRKLEMNHGFVAEVHMLHEQVLAHFEWRKEYKIDTIMEEDWSDLDATGELTLSGLDKVRCVGMYLAKYLISVYMHKQFVHACVRMIHTCTYTYKHKIMDIHV